MSDSESMSELSDVIDEVDDSVLESDRPTKRSKKVVAADSDEDMDDEEEDEEDEDEVEEEYNSDEYDVDLKLPVDDDDDDDIEAIDEEDEEDEESTPVAPRIKIKLTQRARPSRGAARQGMDTSAITSKSGRGQRNRPKPNYAEPGYDDLLDEEEEPGDNDVEDFEEDWESPAPTTDVTKMTGRQRAKYLGTASEEPEIFTPESSSAGGSRTKLSQELLALSNEPIKKKILTEDEIQLRRAENARKRKNFQEKRLEEEKRDTLNKLLKKRASKVKTKSALQNEYEAEAERSNGTSRILDKPRRPLLQHKALFRWSSKLSGSTPEDNKLILQLGIPNGI